MEGTSWMFFLLPGAILLLFTSIGTAGVAVASTSTDDATIQDPGEISAMMTQASEDIQNELSSQEIS
ncbi:MAG: hypothetical protein ACRD8Z_12530 [Nitrososphaeraceae archaeon]